jgi:hypothetical protein
MSVKYLKEMGFRTTRKVVKRKKLSFNEWWLSGRTASPRNMERKKWIWILTSIYQHHLYTTGQEKGGQYNHSGERHIKNALKYNEATEEYSLKLVKNIKMWKQGTFYAPLMFGKKSTLFFSGDVAENFRKLDIAFKEGHLDSAIKSHYLSLWRKEMAKDKNWSGLRS